MYHDEPPYEVREPSLARQRLLAVVVGTVVILVALSLVARFARTDSGTGQPPTAVSAHALAASVTIPGRKPRQVALSRPVAGVQNVDSSSAASFRYPADGSLVRASRLWTQGALSGPMRTARSRVDAGEIDVLGGRIRIRNASLRLHNEVVGQRAVGRTTLTAGTTIEIDGRRVASTANQQVVVNGLGTISINEQAVVANAPRGDRQTGPRRRTVGALVHIRLTRAYAGLPAGSQIVVGRVDAGVRQGKVQAISHPTFTPPTAVGGPPRLQSGTPRPGDASLPRQSTNVRGTAGTSTGNLQGYVFPVLGNASYSNDYGAPRASTGRGHEGNDIFAAQGTPIVAVADGVLDRVGWNSIGGYRYWLFDQYGNSFYHAHLSAFTPLARDGARVKAGDVIGFVGTTGDAQGTPPHLHFEIHPGNGAPTNPFPYLNAWKRGIATAIGALGGVGAAAPGDRLPPLVLLEVADISSRSGLEGSLLESVPSTAKRPVEHEHAPVPTDKSLAAAIDGAAIQ